MRNQQKHRVTYIMLNYLYNMMQYLMELELTFINPFFFGIP